MRSISFKIFNFFGSPVKLNISLLILFFIMSLPLVISFLLSILIHELSHLIVAKLKGYKVNGVEIGLLNGSTAIDIININRIDTILIMSAGPMINLLLYLIIIISGITNQYIESFALVNLFLFTFNILPIYPTDGGKILRDFLMSDNKFGLTRVSAFNFSAKLSLITSIILLLVSVYFCYLFIIVLSIYFIYISLVDLRFIKKSDLI